MVAPPTLTRIPRWTLGLVASALVTQAVPGIAGFLIYDRAGIGSGELWRLLTGHLVHFSFGHLIINLAVLAPAVWLAETRYRSDIGVLLLLAALAIGIALFVGEPGIRQFGGASGISISLLTYVTLRGLHGDLRWRVVCGSVLAILCVKLVAESFWSWSLRDWQSDAGFVAVPLSHVVGAASGLALYAWRSGRGREAAAAAAARVCTPSQ